METVDIVIVCSNGRNRSRILKQHLLEHGYRAHAQAANDKSMIGMRRIRLAKVVIAVHKEIEEQLHEIHELDEKKLITLDVEELTAATMQGKRIDGEAWLEYQRNEMEPALKKQIKKHLPSLEKRLMKTAA